MRDMKRTSGAVALVTAIVAISGCTGAAPSDEGAGADAERQAGEREPAQDIDAWLMPLDQFVPQHVQVRDYAENILIQECMTEAGIAWEVPWVDIDAPIPETTNAVGRRLFDVTLAQRWGYQPAPLTQQNAVATAELNSRPLSDSEAEHLGRCTDAVRAEALPLLSGEAMNFAASLGMAADEAARLSPEVLEAAASWRACMEPWGISDLPRSPDLMPTESMRAEFGAAGGDASAVDQVPVSASAREIEVATGDARCREESGWRQARYDAEWQRQSVALAENADALVRIAEENEALVEAARAVVVERGLG